MEQPGLWETISFARQELASELQKKTRVWMDLTKQQAAALPRVQPFNLPSPWILFGKAR